MDAGSLARRIRNRGAELGLGSVGIAALEPARRAGVLEEWLAAGRAGEMGWMARTATTRIDPRRRFPWARTAVVAAVPYLPYRGDRRGQKGLVAHVARYAVGRDYHRVVGDRLRALASFIGAEAPGARTRPYVDTGPVLERDLAERAGLGWFGKNTNLIGPRGDSWILLGEILTDLDLPSDDPVADRCGTCTACIDACPTAAIVAPYVIDSSRCISYLTIEARGKIPPERRADLGDWVFGCDLCQEVCPWNRKVEAARDAPFHPGNHLVGTGLEDLVRLDEPAFRERFRETPLGRPRRRGLVRNALIVAANTMDGPALEAAPGRLDDADPVVRGAAAWAVGRAGGRRSREALDRARATEADPEVRTEIEAALEEAAVSAPPPRPARRGA